MNLLKLLEAVSHRLSPEEQSIILTEVTAFLKANPIKPILGQKKATSATNVTLVVSIDTDKYFEELTPKFIEYSSFTLMLREFFQQD